MARQSFPEGLAQCTGALAMYDSYTIESPQDCPVQEEFHLLQRWFHSLAPEVELSIGHRWLVRQRDGMGWGGDRGGGLSLKLLAVKTGTGGADEHLHPAIGPRW